jgi:nitric oxide reductase subunit B
MVDMDLFPAGVDQLIAATSSGGYTRSQDYIQGGTFQFFTWLRSIGVTLFVCGGVLPLTWFMLTRWCSLKPSQSGAECFVVPESVLAAPENGKRPD